MEEPVQKALVVTFSLIPDVDANAKGVLNLVKVLQRFFEVDVVCLKGEYVSHIDRINKARILRVPLLGDTIHEKIASFRRAVQRQIEGELYELVIVRSPVEAKVVFSLQEEKGYKVIYEALTYSYSDWFVKYGSLQEQLTYRELEQTLFQEELELLEKANYVVVHSETSKKMLEGRLLDVRNVYVVHYGVSLDHFDWESIGVRGLPIIKVFGPLYGGYDFEGFLTAIEKIASQYEFCVEWYGEGNKESLEKGYAEILKRDLQEIIKLGGNIDWDMFPLFIAGADICVIPLSASERYTVWGDYPVTLLQYLACKKPVVISKIPAVEELVKDGEEVMMYPPEDPTSLANTLLYLLKNREDSYKLAERGYYKIRNNFGDSVQKRGFLELIKRLYREEAKLLIEEKSLDEFVGFEVSSAREELTIKDALSLSKTDEYKLETPVEDKEEFVYDTDREVLSPDTMETYKGEDIEKDGKKE